jgi:hypothetical protein
MKYVVDLPDSLLYRLNDLMRGKGLASLSEIVRIALENQLALEARDEGPVARQFTPSSSLSSFAMAAVPASRTTPPWDGIRLDDLSWNDIQCAPPERIAVTPIWGQINRIFPMKVALRVLARDSSKRGGGLPLDQFSAEAIRVGVRVRSYLGAYDAENEVPRGERLSAAFPENTEKSARRFQAHFLGRVSRDGRVQGALPEFGFVRISPNDPHLVSLTTHGVSFAKIQNPVLDLSLSSAGPLAAEEIEFLLSHLKSEMSPEFTFLTTLLRWIPDGSDNPDELTRRVQKAWPQWSSKVANTMRAGALGRMHDLGLIGRRKDGLRVTYSLTTRGKQLVDTQGGKEKHGRNVE